MRRTMDGIAAHAAAALLTAVILIVGVASPAAAGNVCYGDLDHYAISGVLRATTIVGPNLQKERPYILELDRPACFDLTDEGANAPLPTQQAQRVQVAFSFDDHQAFVAAHLNHRVSLFGQFFAAHTAHHFLPVLILAKQGGEATNTPEAVARAFYAALSRGDGAAASRYVTAGKRQKGPFSADALTQFYGALATPLTLRAVTALDAGRVQATYSWASAAKHCDGTAILSIAPENGALLIQSIKADC